MAGSKSDYLERLVLDIFLGGEQFTPPETLYVALFLSNGSGEDATQVEVTGENYSRVSVQNTPVNFAPATPAEDGRTIKLLTTSVVFPTAVQDWGVVTQWAICDAETGGNVYYYGTFDVPKEILLGDTPLLPPGSLRIYED